MNCPTCGTDCEYLRLGLQLRAARIEAGLSQSKLAEILGFDFTTIKRWEYGWNNPSHENAKVIRMWMAKREWARGR
jgi:transcriptional regulator with XRE-family HTH domain